MAPSPCQSRGRLAENERGVQTWLAQSVRDCLVAVSMQAPQLHAPANVRSLMENCQADRLFMSYQIRMSLDDRFRSSMKSSKGRHISS